MAVEASSIGRSLACPSLHSSARPVNRPVLYRCYYADYSYNILCIMKAFRFILELAAVQCPLLLPVVRLVTVT